MGVQGRAGQPGFSIIEKLCGDKFLESRQSRVGDINACLKTNKTTYSIKYLDIVFATIDSWHEMIGAVGSYCLWRDAIMTLHLFALTGCQ